MKIRIGTRGSDLAMAQTTDAQRRLQAIGCETEVVVIKTSGDLCTDRSFAAIGSPGIFVREIETALMEQRVDLAVHSYKDLPSTGPDELAIAAVPQRVDPADVLLARPEAFNTDGKLLPVGNGAKVGTSSARREALLIHHRPDLQVEPLRGNVPTRIMKLREGRYDAILLACAGLIRLAGPDVDSPEDSALLQDLKMVRLDPATFVPAPSQGAVAYQVRRDRSELFDLVASLDASQWRRAIEAERKLQELIEGGCQLPFGAWCQELEDKTLEMVAFLQGDSAIMVRQQGTDPVELAREVLEQLRPGGTTR